MQHPKTDDKRLPMADKEHHPKSLLNRYGTILRWIKEICNQGDRFARNKPQADHQKKSQRRQQKDKSYKINILWDFFYCPLATLHLSHYELIKVVL